MSEPSTRREPQARDWRREVRSRLSSLRLAPTRESEIVEELSQHLDDRCRELISAGASPDEATRLALAEFRDGDALAKYMAPLRQANAPAPVIPGVPSGYGLTGLVQNLRYVVRVFWKQPAFAAVAVLTLALGIGATTAIFSVVYGVLLKPLPFYEADRLVALYHFAPGFGASGHFPQSSSSYFTYRDHKRVFEDIAVWRTDNVSVIRNGEPEQIQALRVSDGMPSVLGVRPELGRLVRQEDDVPNAPRCVVLMHGYWQRAFGAAPNVIGQSLTIDATPYEIVGVLPASFKLLETDPQVVLPFRLDRATTFADPGFGPRGVARLKPGVTLSQANADIARMIPLIVEQFPLHQGVTREMYDGVGLAPNVRPLSEEVIGELGRPLWILLGTVAIVLLMAWTNVAGLLLVRGEGRQREFAVRAALGASRTRLCAELLSESLTLGMAGGAVGILVAQGAIALLRRMAPAALPRLNDIGIDGVVLLFTLIISVVTALLFGLLPAVRFATLNVHALKDASRSASDTPGRHRTRNTLVVAQVALAMVLTIVSGLMIRTFFLMRQVRPGFAQPAEVQTFHVALPPTLVADRQQVAHTYEEMAERLHQVPGVTAVGVAMWATMEGVANGAPIFVEGQPVSGVPPLRKVKMLGPGYFETMGNPMVAGRAITWSDIFQLQPVAVVSENLAREFWGEPAKAVGKRIGSPGDWTEVVGVAGNERDDGLNRPAPAIVYWPLATTSAGRPIVVRNMAYVVRSSRVGSPGFLHELEQAVWSVNPRPPLGNPRTLDDIQARSMAQTSFAMVMLATAASGALLLALVGVYGVVSYIVTERTFEIGIRIALGARSSDVRRLFLRHGLALTLAGIVLGIGGAMLLTPIMSALLYGVAPTDPATYAGVSIALGAVTLLATYLPARRASRVEPIIALRSGM